MTTVVVTIPQSSGERLATELVKERLAASVNRIECSSTFRWKGEVTIADEEILRIKTTDERYDDLVELVERRHPYEVAPIERLDESDATPEFRQWQRESVRDD